MSTQSPLNSRPDAKRLKELTRARQRDVLVASNPRITSRKLPQEDGDEARVLAALLGDTNDSTS